MPGPETALRDGLAEPPADALQAAHAVRHAVTRLQRRLRALREDHGVSSSKLALLGHLHRNGTPMTAVDLARIERVQPQSLMRNIAELEEAGYLSRQASEADKRHVMIAISEAGRAILITDARKQTAWLAAEIRQRFNETEQGILILAARFLDRVGGDTK